MSFFYKRSFHSFITHTNAKTMPFKDVNETRDPGGIGFAEEEADSLMLCTEYLGFESYDMKMSDDELENKMTCHVEAENERVETKRRKMKENVVASPPRPREQRRREFPPPLSSLNSRGQRSFYLRPVRKDGRLELTQVMIDRPPEIFQTSRENGRLRLHLVDACRDSHETVELDDEPKGLDPHLDENVSGSNLNSGKDINDEDNDQVVDLSMVMNDDSGVTNSHDEVSLKSDDVDVDVAHFYDEHDDASEWRYKSCCKIVNTSNNNHHHHIHPYHHHNSNNNMHLWSRSYVKTR